MCVCGQVLTHEFHSGKIFPQWIIQCFGFQPGFLFVPPPLPLFIVSLMLMGISKRPATPLKHHLYPERTPYWAVGVTKACWISLTHLTIKSYFLAQQGQKSLFCNIFSSDCWYMNRSSWTYIQKQIIYRVLGEYRKVKWWLVGIQKRPITGAAMRPRTRPISRSLVSMTTMVELCSHSILQKSSVVSARGPWVAR